MTPLHLCVQKNQTEICRLLLLNGADPSIVNEKGLTAHEMGTEPIQQLLKDEPFVSAAELEQQLLEAAKNGDLGTVKVNITTQIELGKLKIQ